MSKANLIGQRFGRLEVVQDAGRTKAKRVLWLCRCDCGNSVYVISAHLNNGMIKSCKCLRNEFFSKLNYKHGHAAKESKTYGAWINAKNRCSNSKSKYYKNYGGRGIIMCDEWKNDFRIFLRDMGEAPKGLTLDRIDNNGNYEPSNCRWTTPKQQRENQSKSVIWLTYQGYTKTLIDWARAFKLSYSICYAWHRQGISIEIMHQKSLETG